MNDNKDEVMNYSYIFAKDYRLLIYKKTLDYICAYVYNI